MGFPSQRKARSTFLDAQPTAGLSSKTSGMSRDTGAAGERLLSPAFLSPSWPAANAANGIVTYIDRMIPSLRRLGHRPCVLAACHSADVLWPDVYFLYDEEYRTPLERIIDSIAFRLNSHNALRRRFAGNIIMAALRARAQNGVELLEMEETFGLAQLIKPRLAMPIVLRLHGPLFALAQCCTDSAAHGPRILREGVGIAKADAVSAVSRDILERTRTQYGLPLHDAVVIPNPAPIVPCQLRWRLADCDRSRILFVGRFDRVKGGDTVIDCMRILVRAFPNLQLWFAGPDNGLTDDEGKRWSIKEYLAQHAPEAVACVEWIGTQSQESLAEFRRQAMVTIVASRYEAFGLTVLEAMAYGCPLVATRTGGIAETVADGVNGILCPPADPSAMAAAIARLLTEPNLAATLGRRAGEDAASGYHPDTIARETARFYQRVLDGHRTRPA